MARWCRIVLHFGTPRDVARRRSLPCRGFGLLSRMLDELAESLELLPLVLVEKLNDRMRDARPDRPVCKSTELRQRLECDDRKLRLPDGLGGRREAVEVLHPTGGRVHQLISLLKFHEPFPPERRLTGSAGYPGLQRREPREMGSSRWSCALIAFTFLRRSGAVNHRRRMRKPVNGLATLPHGSDPLSAGEDDPPSRRIGSSAGDTASGRYSDGPSCPRSVAAMTSFWSDQ